MPSLVHQKLADAINRHEEKLRKREDDIELIIWECLCWFIPSIFLVAIAVDFIKWYGL